MTTAFLAGIISGSIAWLASLVGLYVLLRRERVRRVKAEMENEALEVAYQLVLRDLNDAFGVGRAMTKARAGRKGEAS